MFKVASIIKRPNLKTELENKAISLVSNPNSDIIINSINLIALGREVGEIRSSNSAILIRELETLKKGLSAPPIVEEVDISLNFSRDNSDSSTVMPPVSKSTPNLDKVTTPPTPYKNFFNPDKVYQYIIARKGTKLKELESVFNAVSGRTIRRITDSLIKEGKIERVGNPGPTSFYRAPILPVAPVSAPAPIPVSAPITSSAVSTASSAVPISVPAVPSTAPAPISASTPSVMLTPPPVSRML